MGGHEYDAGEAIGSEMTDAARPLPGGWTGLQRREGRAVLDWLSGEQSLRSGFEALAIALRETLEEQVRTAADARDVWDMAPAVLGCCNEPATYTMRHAGIAYSWLHLLDRYARTWLALERLLRHRCLPMGRYGVRVLDIGTGPGPSAFATHDFYAAMEHYARSKNAGDWRQPPDITCVESATEMNHIRHKVAEFLAIRGAPRSVLGMTGGIHDFSTILPARQRRELEDSLRRQYDEWYDDQREEWHIDPVYTLEEANREASSYQRYRLFTFSNFLTTPEIILRFQANFEDILADAHAGSVLLTIGAKGGCYPAIQRHVAELAEAAGFRRLKRVINVAAADAKLDFQLDEEVRWFYRHLKRLAGNLPTNGEVAVQLRKELDDDKPIRFKSSTVHAYRK